MRTGSDKHSKVTEHQAQDHSDRADDNRQCPVCLRTFSPSVLLFLQYVYGQLDLLSQKIQDLDRRLNHLGTSVERQYRRQDEHVAALAACQRDTASVLNHELERHSLYPAVEAAVALAAELQHLQDQAGQLPGVGDDNSKEGGLQGGIDVSCSVAREKLAHIGIKMIAPAAAEPFDPKEHSLCGYISTDDRHMHGKISHLVTAGIVYRDKILRQARVSVFRFQRPDNDDTHFGGHHNED